MESQFGPTKNPYTKKYFKRAMEYFREEYAPKKAAFLYVSDDMTWGRKNLKAKDLFFVGEGNGDKVESVGKDLAVLAVCQHSIVTWGSFSMWSAFLAGGEYYNEYGPIVPHHANYPKKKKKKNH